MPDVTGSADLPMPPMSPTSRGTSMSPTPRPSDAYSTQPPSTPGATDETVVDGGWLGALELRVHTLEIELAEQTAALADARAQLHDSRLGGGDLERVRLIVEALRQRVSGDSEKESVLNRMEAALVRLSASPGLHRPALPPPVAGTRAASAAPPLPAVLPVAIAPAPLGALQQAPLTDLQPPPPAPAATPDLEAAPPPTVEVAPRHTVEPVPDELVLPVPAPPDPVAVPTTTRRRRWRPRGPA